MLEEQRRYYKIGGKEESDYWEREEYLTKVQHPMKDVCMLWGKHSRMSKDGVRGRYNQYIKLGCFRVNITVVWCMDLE